MSNRWERLSDHELERIYLQAAAENFQWLLDSSSLENDCLTIKGWALTLAGEPQEAKFLINGEPFEMTHYPLPSPDIAAIFWNIPTAKTARFTCETRIDDSTYANGFACLEFLDGSDRDQVRRRAWYLPEPRSDLAVPNPSQISRVIGTPDPANYLIGGAAIYKRLEKYLEDKFSKTFDDFPRILDFGCGCGRVARNLRWARQSKVWGVDVDGHNIAWCREHLAHGSFQQIAPVPPLPFPEDYFDLVFAVSILSQLIEEYQCVWLRELQRVVKKDGIILASITGLTQVGLARPEPQLLRRIEEKGFLVTGRNRDLDAAVDTPTYYVSGLHSLDYVREQWGKYFTIVDVVPALVANDDLIVMRNDQPLQEAVLSLPTPVTLPSRRGRRSGSGESVRVASPRLRH